MKARALLAAACLAGCAGPSERDPAQACAEGVGSYRDLQGAVEVVARSAGSSEGSVEIGYEGTGPMNLPVQGSASCTFATDEDGALSLVEATVDGSVLDAADVEAIRRELAQTR